MNDEYCVWDSVKQLRSWNLSHIQAFALAKRASTMLRRNMMVCEWIPPDHYANCGTWRVLYEVQYGA